MKRMVLHVGLGLLLVVVAVAAVVIGRALTTRSRQMAPEADSRASLDAAALAQRLAGAVKFRTVSSRNPAEVQLGEFTALRGYLERTFPKLHAALRREIVNGQSLLYTWQGTDTAAAPALLLAHLDVVPVEPGTESSWAHPPFEGRIADGYVWGRGTMDDKGSLIAIMEAVEALVSAGFRPRRTVLLAFGHDEETGGEQGAARIAALLGERGIRAEFTLDEGLVITERIVPGVRAPVAMVGVAEKGVVSVELVAECEAGHSSRPALPTSVGTLAGAVSRLEARQFPVRLVRPVREMFAFAAAEMSLPMKAVFANFWLFEGLVKKQLVARPATAAQVRTTTAPTMLSASVQWNVLPVAARAVVNYRILQGDSIEAVLQHVRRVVDDPRVRVSVYPATTAEPSPISSTDSAAFATLQRTIRQVFPETIVVPSIMIGASDARLYAGVSRDVYRFVPLVMVSEDLVRIHGTNERISVANYERIVRFYLQLVENCAR